MTFHLASDESGVVNTGSRTARPASSRICGTRGELGQAAIGAAPGKDGDDIDGLRNQGTRDGDDGFLDELLQSAQRADRGAGVQRADATGMAGAPGFEEVERLGAAHLADGNAIGPQTER